MAPDMTCPLTSQLLQSVSLVLVRASLAGMSKLLSSSGCSGRDYTSSALLRDVSMRMKSLTGRGDSSSGNYARTASRVLSNPNYGPSNENQLANYYHATSLSPDSHVVGVDSRKPTSFAPGKGDAGVTQPSMPNRGSRNTNFDSEFNGPRVSSNIQTYNIDDVAKLFGVSLNTLKDIDHFVQDLQLGKHELWPLLSKEKGQEITDIVCNWYVSLSESASIPKAVPTVDDISTKASPNDPNANDILSGMVSPSDLIVQSVDINIKSTSYAGATGASTNEQPYVSSNFHSLVADPVFNDVNVSIPCKVVEKVSTSLEHTLYGYFIGKRLAFPVVEYYARNNWGKHGLKRIMMNSKGFFFFKFDSKAGLEAVLENGPWMIRNTLIILKNWSVSTSLLKEELTRIPIWVKLHDVPLQVFEEDKESSDEMWFDFRSVDEEYGQWLRSKRSRDDKNGKSDRKCFRCGDPNHLIGECPKPPIKIKNKSFYRRLFGAIASEEDDEKVKNETCLVAHASSDGDVRISSYFSDENSSIDGFSFSTLRVDKFMQNESKNNH
ncbi:zinc knuckle CX2CX4HX4C containing protein [Tanacetum coccineum]